MEFSRAAAGCLVWYVLWLLTVRTKLLCVSCQELQFMSLQFFSVLMALFKPSLFWQRDGINWANCEIWSITFSDSKPKWTCKIAFPFEKYSFSNRYTSRSFIHTLPCTKRSPCVCRERWGWHWGREQSLRAKQLSRQQAELWATQLDQWRRNQMHLIKGQT